MVTVEITASKIIPFRQPTHKLPSSEGKENNLFLYLITIPISATGGVRAPNKAVILIDDHKYKAMLRKTIEETAEVYSNLYNQYIQQQKAISTIALRKLGFIEILGSEMKIFRTRETEIIEQDHLDIYVYEVPERLDSSKAIDPSKRVKKIFLNLLRRRLLELKMQQEK